MLGIAPFPPRTLGDAAAFRWPREHAADRRRPKYGDGPCYSLAQRRWESPPTWQKAACLSCRSTCLSNLNVQLWTRRANSTIQCVLDLDSIMFQSCSGGTIKFNFGLLMNGHRTDQIQLSQRKIALGGKGLIARSRPQFLFLFRDIECALRQVSGLPRGVHPGACLFECVLCVANLDANLLFQLLSGQLGLAILKLGTKLISLGDPIPDRDVQVQTNIVIGGG